MVAISVTGWTTNLANHLFDRQARITRHTLADHPTVAVALGTYLGRAKSHFVFHNLTLLTGSLKVPVAIPLAELAIKTPEN